MSVARVRPATILLAEDDMDDRRLAAEALRQTRLPGELRYVDDGEGLMEYLLRRGRFADPAQSPRPGIILLDLNMPRMDGREALRAIRLHPEFRRIPVVVMTTSKSRDDVRYCYELGVNSFICKPTTFAGLVEVMTLLGRYWFEVVELPGEIA